MSRLRALIALVLMSASCHQTRPTSPVITGPSWAIVGQACEFTATGSDLATATVSMRINWSDGDSLHWSAWMPGGACWAVGHEWSDAGRYDVTAQSQSSLGELSDWSSPHPVRVLPAPGYPHRLIDTMFPTGEICDIALSPDGRYLYVAEVFCVEVFSTSDGRLVTFLSLSARSVASSPDGLFLYAADTGILRKVRTSDWVTVDSSTVAAEGAPSDLVVLPDGSKVFCLITAGSGSAALLCFGADHLVPGPSLQLTGVYSVGVSTDGGRLFLPCWLDSYCYVVDAASNTVEARIGVGPEPSGAVVDPRGRLLYMSDMSLGELYVFDISSLRRVRTEQLGHPNLAEALAASPSGDFLYIGWSDFREPDRVRVYSTATLEPVDLTLPPSGLAPLQMLASPDGLKAFMVGPGRRIHVLGF